MVEHKSKDSLGDRMKDYERCYNISLPKRLPVIIRIDGKAFHTLTRHMRKPFDLKFITAMRKTGEYLLNNIQNAMLVYVQSDEISILLRNDKTLETEPWFGNKLQKICSVSASMATSYFNELMDIDSRAQFDARAFTVPLDDVPNYFIWRQRDWSRNSLQMFSRGFFSHNQLEGKNAVAMHDMLHSKGHNWANLKPILKNGTWIKKEVGGCLVFHDKLDWYFINNYIKHIE